VNATTRVERRERGKVEVGQDDGWWWWWEDLSSVVSTHDFEVYKIK
jgi:hypothetical protein